MRDQTWLVAIWIYWDDEWKQFYQQYQFPHSSLIERRFEVLMFQIRGYNETSKFTSKTCHQRWLQMCSSEVWDNTMISWWKGAQQHVPETMILVFFFAVGTCQRPKDNGVSRHDPCQGSIKIKYFFVFKFVLLADAIDETYLLVLRTRLLNVVFINLICFLVTLAMGTKKRNTGCQLVPP